MFSSWMRSKALGVRNALPVRGAQTRRQRRPVRRCVRLECLEPRRVLAAVINELHIPTAFPQNSQHQYVEIRGDANEMLADGTYLVAVDGFGNAGNVRAIFDLSNVQLGANGFLVLNQQENKYIVPLEATELTGAGDVAGGFGGLRAPGDPAGTSRFSDNSVTGNTLAEFLLEPTSFLLIQSDTAPTIDQDIDADDDLARDGDAAAWTILDSVAVVPFGTDVPVYSGLVFAASGATAAGPVGVQHVTLDGLSWVGRNGDTVGSAPDDWIGAKASEVTFLSSNYRLDNGLTVPPVFAGRHLNHVGTPNFFATISGQVFQDDNGDRMKQETESGMPNVPVRLVNSTNGSSVFFASELPPPASPAPNPTVQNAFPLFTLTTVDAKINVQRSGDTAAVRVVELPALPGEFVFAHGDSDPIFKFDNALRIDFYDPVKSVELLKIGQHGELVLELYDNRNKLLSRTTKTTQTGIDILGANRPTSEIAYAVAYCGSDFFAAFSSIEIEQPNPTATTDANGNYRIPRVVPRQGAFNVALPVAQTRPDGFTQTFPAAGLPLGVFVDDTTAKTGLNFGNQPNNQPPAAESPQNFSVEENSPAGTAVGTVAASDPNAGQSLTYAITGGTGQGKFNINSMTGALTVADGAGLDFEGETNSFTLNVTVTDNAPTPATTAVDVQVNLTNVDEPPTQLFLSANTISELADTTANPVIVGNLTNNDPDGTPESLRYVIEVVGPDSETFGAVVQLDGALGGVFLRQGKTLDFETKPEYSLEVVLQKFPGLEEVLRTSFDILVLDENEPATAVTLSSNTISETADTSSPVIIGALGTDDPDTTTAFNNYTFILPPDVEDNNVFELVGPDVDGVVSLALRADAALDHEDQPTLTVEVHAFGGESTVITTLTVEVLGNQPPAADSPQNFSVGENSSAGTAVGTVVANDPDDGQTLTYAITGGTGQGKFNIDAATGALTVAAGAALDFEDTDEYSLAVTVTDNAPTPATATVEVAINLTDVDEPSTQIFLSSNTVSELADTSSPVVIGNLGTDDPDTTAAFNDYTFVLSPDTDEIDNDAFELVDSDSNGSLDSLALKAGVTLDRTTKPTFTVQVEASGAGGPPLTTTLTVNVVSANSPPVVEDQAFDVPENSVAEFEVGTVVASDPDAGQTLTYEITGGTGAELFTIDAETGALMVAEDAVLNFEGETNSYTLDVKVTDNAPTPASTTATVTINLTDVDEPPTKFMLVGNTISELAGADERVIIGNLTTDDPDGVPLEFVGYAYSFVLSEDAAPFEIIDEDNDGNGVLALKPNQTLDFEIKPEYQFEVILSLFVIGSPELPVEITRASLTIEVLDGNDPPVAKNFAESTGPGEPITFDVVAGATDADGTIDPESVAIVTGPEDGVATVGEDGAITYTPAEGFHGFDDFTYTVQDDQGGVSNVATITVDVSQPVPLLWQRDETFREDVDGDNDVDLADLLAVVRFLRDNGLVYEFTTPPQPGDALVNVDGDEIASINDLLMMVRALRDQQNAGLGEGEAPRAASEAAAPPAASPPLFFFVPDTDDDADSREAALAQLAADVTRARHQAVTQP